MSKLEKAMVLNNRRVGPELFVMEVSAAAMAGLCRPGQFLHVKPGGTDDPLLRRPLSIYDAVAGSGRISLLYQVVGKGTGLLTDVKVNDTIDLMGPLGRGFTLPDRPENIVLVGGGVGIAPLLYLGRVLRERQCQVKVLGGAGTAAQLVAEERFQALRIEFITATLDGSAGIKGLVVDLLDSPDLTAGIDRVYTCGPEPMMAAVAGWARARNIWGEVSLEEHMACGVGACLGCARKLKHQDEGYVKVCKDGPVFNFDEIEFYKNLG
ncbi:MAG: dihydroorotate dehydrogenase electron transfer subunit [Syntrophomonadaceae bacterium]|nr:dihydroorotate dehydrogenase electron transfer subunit [Syntrophomonadaceae bacterium]